MDYARVPGIRPRLALGVLLLLAAAAVPARGQGVTATISGTVKDTQGAVVPGATVTIISESKRTQSAPVVKFDTGTAPAPSAFIFSTSVVTRSTSAFEVGPAFEPAEFAAL